MIISIGNVIHDFFGTSPLPFFLSWSAFCIWSSWSALSLADVTSGGGPAHGVWSDCLSSSFPQGRRSKLLPATRQTPSVVCRVTSVPSAPQFALPAARGAACVPRTVDAAKQISARNIQYLKRQTTIQAAGRDPRVPALASDRSRGGDRRSGQSPPGAAAPSLALPPVGGGSCCLVKPTWWTDRCMTVG